jgi:hypothetical protein
VSKLWPVEGCRTDAVSLLTLRKSAVDPPQSQCSGMLQTIGRMVSGWSHSHSLEWFLVSVKALHWDVARRSAGMSWEVEELGVLK